MSQRYIRPDWFTSQVLNPVVSFCMSLGISVMGSRVLAVRGRTSGEWRTTPVNVLTHEGHRYLVSPRGATQWVRNVRAGGEVELRLGGQREPVHLDELSDEEKPGILRPYLRRWAFEVAEFFDGVGAEAAESEFERVAPDHPVFRIRS